jgi:hypothetical protein
MPITVTIAASIATVKWLPGYVRPNFCEMIAASPFRE